MVFLDTDMCVGFLRGEPAAVKQWHMFENAEIPIKVSSVTAMELFEGANSHVNFEEKVRDVTALLEAVVVVPFDIRCARECGRILSSLRKAGSIIDLPDIQIASCVLGAGDALLTRNIKDFQRVPHLRV